jgi:uncharacterized RDD family membrane protein YckC
VPVSASEKLTIDTPEQIALEFPLASAGSRFLALAIDTLIQVAGFIVLGVIAAAGMAMRTSSTTSSAGTWAAAIAVLFLFLIYYGYYAAFEALWSGQTPGKRLIHLRVISTSGRPITVFDALVRNLVRTVDQLPGIYTVGLLSIFLTERNQRLGDLAADTVVVHEQPIEPHALAVPPSLEQALDADRTSVQPPVRSITRRGAARLTAQEIAVVETFLARRTALPERMRHAKAHAIAARVRMRLEIPASPAVDDEVLLEEIAAEFRGR